MTYLYHDLGAQRQGSTAVIRWHGSGADVLLLDPVNFSKYRRGQHPVAYSGGGQYRRAPASLSIPEDGRWYVVADLRGTSARAAATVEVRHGDDGDRGASPEEALVSVE